MAKALLFTCYPSASESKKKDPGKSIPARRASQQRHTANVSNKEMRTKRRGESFLNKEKDETRKNYRVTFYLHPVLCGILFLVVTPLFTRNTTFCWCFQLFFPAERNIYRLAHCCGRQVIRTALQHRISTVDDVTCFQTAFTAGTAVDETLGGREKSVEYSMNY